MICISLCCNSEYSTLALLLLLEGNGALDRAQAAIAVAQAAQDSDPCGVALLLASDWELVLLEEHVVKVNHLADNESLLNWTNLGTLDDVEVIDVGSGAHSTAALGAILRLFLRDLGQIFFASLGADIEGGVAAPVIQATEACRTLNHSSWRLAFTVNVAWGILKDIHGRCAATTSNRHFAHSNDCACVQLTSLIGKVWIGWKANMEAHLILAHLAANEAVGEASTTAQAFVGDDRGVWLRYDVVGSVDHAAAAVLALDGAGGHEEVGDGRVLWVAANAAPEVPHAAVAAAVAVSSPLLDNEHGPRLWVAVRLILPHRLVRILPVTEDVAVGHDATGESLQECAPA